ncbi:MAG: hypothetical protein H3C33_05445 [Rhodocyclaceae bacterium]|nr:hypothetical protein [Rhodocyclaceae bacterium]
MKTPKLLPWYACKAGIPIERANALWRKAVREATERTGWVGTSEYWGVAMEIFLASLEAEQCTLCTPRVTPLLRSQNRIWRLPLTAMEDVLSAVSAGWPRPPADPRKAA